MTINLNKKILKILIYISLSIGLISLWSISMGVSYGMNLAIIFFMITIFLFFKFNKINEYKKLSQEDFDALYNDNGIFEYEEQYFKVQLEDKIHLVNWNSIKTILAYKLDVITVDIICLEIFCENDLIIQINEETKGWYQFIKTTKKQFSKISKSWDVDIIQPPFERNLTLVYDRENRNLEDVHNSN